MEKLLLLSHLSSIFTKIKAYVQSVLPVAATSAKAGLVKPGNGLAVGTDGTLSVTKDINVDPSQLPKATSTTLGAVMIGSNINVDATGKISVAAIPTNVSAFTNDKKYQTEDEVAKTVDDAAKAAVAEVVGGAPETFDTLKEIADYIEEHKSVEETLNAAIGNKADKTALNNYYTKTEGDARYALVSNFATQAEVDSELTKVFGAVA